ncbi:MAG TPA: hypothetical protein ENN76_00245 [Euryarchaeota archaeon]|nr:hypothetical protein [Euryarchaeota archaeon]
MTFQGKIRGVHFTRVFKYIKKKKGVVGLELFFEKANEKLPPAKPIMETTYSEKEWYPYEHYLDILELADNTFGKGDGELAYDIGLTTIKDLGILSYITRKPDINYFVENAQKNWSQVYDFGELEIKRPSANEILFRYKGFPKRKVRCRYFAGSIQGMLEICHLIGKVKEISCSVDNCCEYLASWK